MVSHQLTTRLTREKRATECELSDPWKIHQLWSYSKSSQTISLPLNAEFSKGIIAGSAKRVSYIRKRSPKVASFDN